MEIGQGYLYVVCGEERYFREAVDSVASLKSAAPKAHATIVVDRSASQIGTELSRWFDKIIVAPHEGDPDRNHVGYSFKVRHMYSLSPYRLTCFLDTDTYIVEDTTPLFDLLKFYDLVIAPAPGDLRPICDREGNELFGYTAYNTGVIHFRKSEANQKLFEAWLDYQVRESRVGYDDQATLMQALLESPCRVYVTQSTFNARLPFTDKFIGKVRIVHSRPSQMGGLSMADAAARVNRTEGLRVWLQVVNECLYRRMPLRRWLFVAMRLSLAFFGRNVSWATSRARTAIGRRVG